MEASFKLIKAYAKNLGVLASTDYTEKLNENADLIGSSLDTLVVRYNAFGENKISVGIGKFAQEGIKFLGEKRISSKRAEALRKYITAGEELIQNVCKTSKTFFEEKVAVEWIGTLNDEVKSLHEGLRSELKEVESKNILEFIEVDERIAALYDQIFLITNLNDALIKSIDNLSKAHSKLSENIQEKTKLEDVISELATFMSNVSELADLHEKLKVETRSNAK
ncbi:MAG: hypothetical protein GQ574_23970 [Crocinitomix sp.]|nr:hypothetical protein [Crocinitomix sp.]